MKRQERLIEILHPCRFLFNSDETFASCITKKNDELEKEGFIYTIQAKGCYVAPKNLELIREENLKKIEELMDEIIRLAALLNLSREDVLNMLNFSLEELK